MRFYKKSFSFIAALIVSFSTLFVFSVPHAFAATKTWTGGGSDTNMNTAGNWGGSAPSAGDDLVFPANSSKLTVVNNYAADTSFNSITFSGTATQESGYTISGNAFTVVAGITASMAGANDADHTISANLTLGGAQTITVSNNSRLTLSGTFNISTYATAVSTGTDLDLYMSGVTSGSGTITKTGAGVLSLVGNNSSYSGAIIVSAGAVNAEHVNALGTAAGGTTVASGAVLVICVGANDATLTEPLTLSGTGIGAYGAFRTFPGCHMGGGPDELQGTYSFSGALTLGADTTFSGYQIDATFTGTYTTNGHSFTPVVGSVRTLTLPSGVVTPAVLTTTYESSAPSTSVTASTNNIAIVTGTYSTAYVEGGTLKGTGTVGGINMTSGKVAPGLSPGCLNSGDLTFSGGTYEAELGGTTACTEYDQLKVTGTVGLGTATTLTTSLYNNFKPKAGDKFTIIDNDSTDAVTGTFTGLAEGATFTVSGYVFKISYVGGTGNDVVLTVLTVPAVGNTGFKLLASSPIAIAIATAAVTFGAYFLSRRYAEAKVK